MSREKLACLCCAIHCTTGTFLLSHLRHTPGQFKMHSTITNVFLEVQLYVLPLLWWVQRSTSTTCYERSWNTWPESCAWPENHLGAYYWTESSIAIILGRLISGRQRTDFQQRSRVWVNPGSSGSSQFLTSAMSCPAMSSIQHTHSVSKIVHWRNVVQSWQLVKNVGIILSHKATFQLPRHCQSDVGSLWQPCGYIWIHELWDTALLKNTCTPLTLCTILLFLIHDSRLFLVLKEWHTVVGILHRNKALGSFLWTACNFPSVLEKRGASLLRSKACSLILLYPPKSTKMGIYIKTPTRYWLPCQNEHVFLAGHP